MQSKCNHLNCHVLPVTCTKFTFEGCGDAFAYISSVLPIPIVAITGGVRHKDYLIRHSYNESHPHYEEYKA